MTKYFSFNTSELQNELIKPEIIGDFPIYQDSPYQNDFLVIETNSMPRYERMTHNLEEKIFYNLAAMMEENKVKPIRMPQVMKESVTVWDKLKQGLKQLKKNVRDSIITGDKQSEDIPSNKFSMSLSAFGGNASILTNARGLLIIPLLSRRMCLLNLQVNWREFQFVEWHPTIKDSLALTFSNKVNIVKLGGDDELIHLRELEYSNVTVLKWSSNGEYCLILSDNGKTFSILDSNYKLLFTKSNPIRRFVGASWAENTKFIVLYTGTDVYVMNVLNLSFKSYSQFNGDIIDVLIPENSLYILITTKGKESHHIYVLYNLLEDYYNVNLNDSYNNPPQAYTHSQFKLYYRIYCLLNPEYNEILKMKMNSNDNRLILLIRRKFSDGTVRNVLSVYDIHMRKSVHEISIRLLYNIYNFKDMEITDFTLHFSSEEGKNVLYTLFGEDKLLARTLLDTRID